jgi:hypothetical protein
MYKFAYPSWISKSWIDLSIASNFCRLKTKKLETSATQVLVETDF